MMQKLRILAVTLLLLTTTLAGGATPLPAELLSAGRVDEAIRELQTHLQKTPGDSEAYSLLARAYYSLQRWDDAIRAAQKAVALAPTNSMYHLWLGRAYGEKAERSSWFSALSLARKLRAEFERAVQLDSANAAARSDLSEFYMEAPGFLGGGKDKALAQARILQSTHPEIAHWVRARVAEKDKNYRLAEQEFRAAVQAAKHPAENWLSLAAFYWRLGRLDEMEDAVHKAVMANPGSPDDHALYDAAALLFRAGRDFPAAIDLVRQYLASNRISAEAPLFQAHFLLGSIYEKQGKRKEAADEYRISLSLAKDYVPTQTALKRVQ
ncbi:MAG: tetratricopeptide repeat protein [Terriglobales bacterium]